MEKKETQFRFLLQTYIPEKCLLLDLKQLLSDYRTKKMSSKTFSLLLAEKIGLEVFPGFALFITDGQVQGCVALNSESLKMDLEDDKKYVIRYDFLHSSINLYKWLSSRHVRPKPCIYTGKQLKENFCKLIEKGLAVQGEFIILIQNAPEYVLFGHTITDEYGPVFTEVSRSISISHGRAPIDFCFAYDVKNRNQVQRHSSHDIVNAVHKIVVRFQPYMGNNLHVEWFLSKDRFFVSHVRPSYPKSFPYSAFSQWIKKDETKIQIVSHGSCQGYLRSVPSSDEKVKGLAQFCLENQRKFIFLAKKPLSKLVPLIPCAKGFIFREGSLLCHFAILLRESEIPAVILMDSKTRLKTGTLARIDAEPRAVAKFVKGQIEPHGTAHRMSTRAKENIQS